MVKSDYSSSLYETQGSREIGDGDRDGFLVAAVGYPPSGVGWQ